MSARSGALTSRAARSCAKSSCVDSAQHQTGHQMLVWQAVVCGSIVLRTIYAQQCNSLELAQPGAKGSHQCAKGAFVKGDTAAGHCAEHAVSRWRELSPVAPVTATGSVLADNSKSQLRGLSTVARGLL